MAVWVRGAGGKRGRMSAMEKFGEALSRRSAIPPGVWALGAVSLLMDASSEMIH